MLRSLLLKMAARAKATGNIDDAIRNNPLFRRRAARLVARYPGMSAAEAELEGSALLSRILKDARHTPYGARLPSQPEDWPILEKKQIYGRPRDFINPRLFIRVPAASSGTSGIPLKLWRSLENIAAEQSFLDALLAPYGQSMRSRMAVLRADSIKPMDETRPPYARLSHDGTRLTLSTPHLNAATLAWYVEAITCFAPAILFVYPSAALNLLTLLRNTGAQFKIPLILSSSEMLSDAAHAALAEFFGATVLNYYGQAERACLAYAHEAGKFRFHPLYGRVELARATPSGGGGENTVRILATGYWNRAMPLIRYDTGDLLYVPSEYGPDEYEEIARGRRSFSGIAGRDGEYILTRDGMRIIGLNHIPREVKNVAQVQLVQPDYDTVIIRVIPLPGYGKEDAGQLLHQARAKLPASMNASVETADRLAATPQGKTPFVLRLVS